MWSYIRTHEVVVYSKFHRNPFSGFRAALGRNLTIPITLAIGFYNSLYYRTVLLRPDLQNFEVGVISRMEVVDPAQLRLQQLTDTVTDVDEMFTVCRRHCQPSSSLKFT